MDFKWKLSRPGIELEFETGSIGEAIGMLEEEGTKIAEVFGFTMGAHHAAPEQPSGAQGEEPAAKRGRGKAKPVEAVAPEPLPVPSAAAAPLPPTVTTLPPNALPTAPAAPAASPLDIPAYLQRAAPAAAAPPPPTLPSPPTAPPAPTPPPVGVLGPKVVAALEVLRAGQPDGGAALADWLHGCGLTQKGATYDAACRVVLMTSDEKLGAIAEQLKVAA